MSEKLPTEVEKEITDSLFAGRKIDAIKIHREHTGMGLKQSKDFIEAMEAELRAKDPSKFSAPAAAAKGCTSIIALCVFACLVVGALVSLHG